MEQQGAPQSHDEATPIFEGFRRGYDPEQVDRFVADQQRRLDDTLNRATEAERRLAAAVGQLRELHRRVAMLESEERVAKAPAQPLDTVGERIQRILQEAWEGAAAIRQSAEDEAAEIRQRTLGEAETVVNAARRKAQEIAEEIARRREAYIGRVEEERSKAVAQITYLREQRKSAVGELIRMKDAIESTVGKVAPRRANSPESEDSAVILRPFATKEPASEPAPRPVERIAEPVPPRTVRDIAPKTMPVFHLNTSEPTETPDRSELVRNHRAAVEETSGSAHIRSIKPPIEHHEASSTVFDFDQE